MKKIIVFLLAIFLISSCSISNIGSKDLNGKWYLQEAFCYCYFGDNFDFSSHTLTFDLETKKVLVKNKAASYFIEQNGTYDIKTKVNELTINNAVSFTYEILGSTLTLVKIDEPNIADDELTLIYKR